MTARFPGRIVCLTEETTETLYLLGAQDRIVGVSGYTARPKEARQKPKVSAFTSAKIDKIIDLAPDLVLTFSDLQADLARDLIARGVNVLAFNQRSVSGALEMILTLGRIVDRSQEALDLVARFEHELAAVAASAAVFSDRPKVFFEEWKDPLISGIRWVEELIEIAGGTPVFPELREASLARDRVVQPETVVQRDPDVIIASWCGMKVNKDSIRQRPGWERISAIKSDNVFEVKSTYILAPGPAALSEGVRQLHAILCHATNTPLPAHLQPAERLDSAVRERSWEQAQRYNT